MLRPDAMQKFDLLVFDVSIDRVTEGIVESGLLHPVRVTELEPWAEGLAAGRAPDAVSWENASLARARDLLAPCAPRPAPLSGADGPADQAEADKHLLRAEERFHPLRAERAAKSEEISVQERMLQEIGTFALDKIGFPLQKRYSFLEIELGNLPEENLPFLEAGLKTVPHVVLPVQKSDRRLTVIVIVLRKDRAVLDKSLDEAGFDRARLPPDQAGLDRDLQSAIAATIARLQDELAEIDRRIGAAEEALVPGLLRLRRKLELARTIAKAKSYFRKTQRTYLISGWVPKKRAEDLVKRVRDLTEGRCYFEFQDPEAMAGVRTGEIQVPVAFSHPPFLKPFEILVREYGVPDYRAIDPTPFVAVTFLILFGAMFGDVGHGLLLALGGLFLRTRPKIARIAALLLYCGLSSMVFGFLYGEFCGYEELIPAFWLRPMRSVASIMQAAVLFGVAVVTLGLLLNIVNALRSRRFLDAVFDKAGLIGALFYWGAAGLAIKALIFRSPTPPSLMVALLGLPILLLFLKAPLRRALGATGKMFPEGVLTYLLETAVEVIELVTGYLANTVSFIRVAAFALAHIGLFLALFSLIRAVRAWPLSGLWTVLLLIIGNLGIILLEGIVVVIQSIRLEYYEFFSKFFPAGKGVEYHPLTPDN
jgi:V/A-type H+-transporting ATPase subunit I